MATGKEIKKVLIFDDDRDYRNLVKTYLAKNLPGTEIIEYDPVAKGAPREDFDWSGYDVMVLDYYLCIYGTTGLDILQKNRKKPGFPATIMLTGAGDEEVAVRALDFGVSEYLRKEKLTKEILIESVNNAYQKHNKDVIKQKEQERVNHVFDKALFYKQLEHPMDAAVNGKQRVLFLIGVDNLDALATEFGLLVRDNLLRHIAGQSYEKFRIADNPFVTRLGDSSVGVLIDFPDTLESLENSIRELCEHLGKNSYLFAGKTVPSLTSIGALVLDHEGKSISFLVDLASQARGIARQTPGNSWHIFRLTESLEREEKRKEEEGRLHQAKIEKQHKEEEARIKAEQERLQQQELKQKAEEERLRHEAELERQRQEEEKRKLEEEQKRLDAERQRLEAEKKRQAEEEKKRIEEKCQREAEEKREEEERQKLEVERRRLEAERRQLEEQKRKLEEEEKKRLEEQRQREIEEKREEDERQKLEAERRRLEVERQQLQEQKHKLKEEEKKRLEKQRQDEAENKRKEEERKKLEEEHQRLEAERQRLELERKRQAEEEKKRIEEQRKREAEQKRREEERKKLEEEHQRLEAERQRLEEEKRRRAADEKKHRLAEEERKQKEEQDRIQQLALEKKRHEEESRRKVEKERQYQEEQRRLQEKKRKAGEDKRLRHAELERNRQEEQISKQKHKHEGSSIDVSAFPLEVESSDDSYEPETSTVAEDADHSGKNTSADESDLDEYSKTLKKVFDDNRILQTFQPVVAMFTPGPKDVGAIFKVDIELVELDGSVKSAQEINRQNTALSLQQSIDHWMLREIIGQIVNSDDFRAGKMYLMAISEAWLTDITLFTWLKELLTGVESIKPGKHIALELPVSMLITHKRRAMALIRALKKSHSFRIALGDIKTLEELNSLAGMLEFNLLTLKCNIMEELRNKSGENDTADFLKAIKNQGARIIIDGVEDSTMLTDAISFGADYVMGRFIGEPENHLTGTGNVESFHIS